MSGGQKDKLRRVSEAIERGFEARTSAELDAIMAKAFAQFGIDHFSMDQMRDSSGAMVGIHHFGNWPEDWGAHYIEQRHYRHDRVVRHALMSPSPLRWMDAQERDDISSEEARLFGEAREFGLKDGLCTPVHHLDGNLSAVSVHSSETLELSTADELAIRLLSIYYCSFGLLLKFRPRASDQPKMRLTPRQRECLQWVRAGKSSWAIGEIVGISERTVNFHIEDACRRLGVQTRHQAVMEATVRGMISL
jgi:DNA-binding CsgD family transcriptional regulator